MPKKKPPATLHSSEELSEEVPKGELVLAFDLSSSCIGWAIGVDRDLVNYGKFVFKTTATLGEKILAFSEFLDSLIEAYTPDKIILEEPLKRAKVRVHFEFLGVLRLHHMLFKGEDIPSDHFISPTKIKTHLHVKRGKNHKENKKIMINKINRMFGLSLNFQYGSIKSDDDIADAIAVWVTWGRINTHDD